MDECRETSAVRAIVQQGSISARYYLCHSSAWTGFRVAPFIRTWVSSYSFSCRGSLPFLCSTLLRQFKSAVPRREDFLGKKCFVVRRVGGSRRRIVRVFSENNQLSAETWSAESNGPYTIEEGRTAKAVRLRSIILLVEEENDA